MKGPCLGERDVVVIGAGPVGIAALWFARAAGLSAVAVDAAVAPLATIRAFLPGLVMASGATEWEIDGLPLDCRTAREITREEILSYYARVVAYGQLELRCRHRVTAITPLPASDGAGVRVAVDTPDGAAHWLARRVIITPWFRRRALDLGPSIAVRDALTELPIGEQVAVVGAGLSGLETCDALIRAGLRVTLLARRARPLPDDLATLFEISGSTRLDGVTALAAARPGVLAVHCGDAVTEIACTVAVNCTGHEINRDLLAVLRASDVMTAAEVRMLESFRVATLIETHDLRAIAASLPRLGDAIRDGRRGVHFAGTLFHVGGVRGAGIICSIQTARWVIDAIAGRLDGVPAADVHIPELFLAGDQLGALLDRPLTWSPQLAALIPVPIPTWSRGTKVLSSERRDGTPAGTVSRDSRAFGEAAAAALSEIREVCYDGLSVAELAEQLECDRETLLWALAALWRGNGLTWLPPAG